MFEGEIKFLTGVMAEVLRVGGGEERKGRAKMWAFGGEGRAGGGIVAGGTCLQTGTPLGNGWLSLETKAVVFTFSAEKHFFLVGFCVWLVPLIRLSVGKRRQW